MVKTTQRVTNRQPKVASKNLDDTLRSVILRLKAVETSVAEGLSSYTNEQISAITSEIAEIRVLVNSLISGNHVYGADIYISLDEPNNVNEDDVWFDLNLVRFL